MKVLPKLKFLAMLPRYEQNNDRPAFRRPDQSEPVAAAASGDKAQLAAEFKAVGQAGLFSSASQTDEVAQSES